MSEDCDETTSLAAQKRLQPFLDCVAYLMAKRWLREQRQQKKLQQEMREPDDDQAEP